MRPIVVITTDASGAATNSGPVRLDEWSPGPAVIQVTVTGTVSYTVQGSNDDPNSPTNPVALGSMTWVDIGGGAQTTTKQFNLAASPQYVRVLQATGSGSTVITILQNGSPSI